MNDPTSHAQAIDVEADPTPLSALARQLPALKRAPGVDPWDPDALDLWASRKKRWTSERCAAQWILSIWNPLQRWRCGSFELSRALQLWGEQDRAALAAWTQAPFWP